MRVIAAFRTNHCLIGWEDRIVDLFKGHTEFPALEIRFQYLDPAFEQKSCSKRIGIFHAAYASSDIPLRVPPQCVGAK